LRPRVERRLQRRRAQHDRAGDVGGRQRAFVAAAGISFGVKFLAND
jgi:hypothetical protein